MGPFFAVSYSKPALCSTYLLYLHTIIGSWKGRLILWADQLNTFFLSLKSYISSLFPLLVLSVLPSQQVFDDESYLRRQNCNFLFLSSVCTGGRKAISKLMFPNSGCQFQWKTNLFLEKLGMVEATRKSLKKKLFSDDVAIIVYVISIEALSGFSLWFDNVFSNTSRIVIEFF